jgi:hypothetical protein
MLTATHPEGASSFPPTGGKTAGCQRREAAIRARVLESLGRPGGLFRVSVAPLWDNNYRVNVMTGADATAVLIPHSYFVVVDDDGNILRSTPRLRREY